MTDKPAASDLPLGRDSGYPERYDPGLLVAIPRAAARDALGIASPLPFTGADVWNAWELSWLDGSRKPVAATVRFEFPVDSDNIIESKSMKLYLGSLAMRRFRDEDDVIAALTTDIAECVSHDVDVQLAPPQGRTGARVVAAAGFCIDDLDIGIDTFEVEPALLTPAPASGAEQTIHSHLFRSLCPVTGQPDFATIVIRCSGSAPDRAGLLRYLVSYRNHADFHEACAERIFIDITDRCRPDSLTVVAYFTRRGGIDINPWRSSASTLPDDLSNTSRLWRQ